jgi:alpha-tubulin suppressor-like RCC1 family protein
VAVSGGLTFHGSGQLGNGGSTLRSNVPVAVSVGLTFQSVSAGFTHSCGVTTAGDAYCWGSNKDGQLGDGTNTKMFSNVPVGVDPPF